MMKEEIKNAFEKIEIGVKGVFESENYKKYLKTMSKFHKYSVNNSILIMMQYPNASMVTGASKWATMNRTIRKGAKAIKILIPHPYTKEIETTDEKGNAITVEQNFVWFSLGSVFDIEQTEGEDLPSICNELEGDSDEVKELISVLEKVSKCPVAYWNLKDGSKGFYSVKDSKIVISKNLKSDTQRFKTLAHEIAHSRLHGEGTNRQQAEIEAESIAYVVAAHFGINTEEYSFEYIANWSRNKDSRELKQILTNIQKQAKVLIEEIEAIITKEEQ